jgi:hypothetical protein
MARSEKDRKMLARNKLDKGEDSMRYAYYSKGLVLTSALTISIFFIISCSPVEIKKVTYQKADYYKLTSQKAGLRISIDPYMQEDRLKEFFGCDLPSRGVLPVLVVIENQNAEDGYIFLKEKSGLLMKDPDSKNTSNNSSDESYKSDKLDQALKTDRAIKNVNTAGYVGSLPFIATGAIATPVILIGIIPMAISEKRVKDELAIMRNYEYERLEDKTIYQGGSNRGFIYFQINCKEDMNKIQGLQLSMKNIRSKEITTFIIPINE